ncbi:flagellin [bacterium]|nr:flagellin [bacterium]
MAAFDPSGISATGGALSAMRAAMSRANEAIERIGSGLRINRSADDPAGLAISERLRSEVRGLNRAAMNAMDEVSMLQTADSALGEINASLQNVHELSVYSGNPILTAEDQQALKQQVDANLQHIDSVVQNAEFNGRQLLSGELGSNMSTGALGMEGYNVTGGGSIAQVSDAIGRVSEFRSTLGARQNELISNINSLEITAENTLAAESRIRDADIAEEATKLTATQLQLQASMAALAQANVNSKAVLSLLQSETRF